MNVPENLQFLFQTIPGWATNVYKMLPQSVTAADPGSFTTFTLPENQLVDLSSLAIFADVITIRGNTNQTLPASSTPGRTNHAVLPLWTSSLIEQVVVSVNGSQIDASCLNYNRLAKLFHDFHDGNAINKYSVNHLSKGFTAWTSISPGVNQVNVGGIGNSGVLAITQANSDFYGGTAGPGDPTYNALEVQFDNFLGFLSCGKILDTSLLGRVDILIKWAPSTVIMTEFATVGGVPATVSGQSYQLQNLRGLVNVCDIDPIYYAAMSARLEQGPITMNYKRFLSFQSGVIGGSGSIRWSVASQSLDALYAVPVLPSNRPGFFTAPSNPTGALEPGSYFVRSAADRALALTTGELRGWIQTTQASINSTLYPMFPATVKEQLQLALKAFDLQNNHHIDVWPEMTHNKWFQEYYVFAMRFSHSPSLDWKSGIDTRGLQINGSVDYVINGTEGPYGMQSLIFLETTASLNIGAFRSVSVVY
jgi:hypothetical protein